MPAQTYLDQVQNAYIAYYGRPADPAGQNYWASQLEIVGGNLTALVNQFGNSDEFNAFAAGKNKSELINQLYLNLFNRSADKAGLDWYVGEVEAGRKTIATIALDVLNGATGVDTATLASKFQAANAFSAALDTPTEVGSYNANSLDSVKNWLKGITTATEATQAVTGINNNLPTILLMQAPTTAPTEAPTTAPTEAPTTAPTEAPTTTNIIVPVATAAGNATATTTATASADVLSFDAVAAAAQTNNTQGLVSGFAVATDKLSINLATASGNMTLAALNGQQGVVVQTDPFAGSILVTFGPDANGDLVTLTLAGITDPSLVNLMVV